jgi:hypothetical protein
LQKKMCLMCVYMRGLHTHLSCKHKCVSVCKCMHLSVCWHACICMNQILHVGTQRPTSMYGSSYVSIYICMQPCMHACTRICIHTYEHTCIHTCVHLHAPAQVSRLQSADGAACGRVPGPHVASDAVRGLLLHATWAHACVCTCDG